MNYPSAAYRSVRASSRPAASGSRLSPPVSMNEAVLAPHVEACPYGAAKRCAAETEIERAARETERVNVSIGSISGGSAAIFVGGVSNNILSNHLLRSI